jgi:2-oxoglutarate dehydrogenase E1 component
MLEPMADDSGQLRQVFEETAFLYGGNAAYIDDLFERYGRDPASVEPSWRAFFESLREQPQPAPDWARAKVGANRDELTSALDGQWPLAPAVQAKAAKSIETASRGLARGGARRAKDSVRAIMLVRSYRIRGHYAANLDPLGIEEPQALRRTRPGHLRLRRERLRPADLPRRPLGLETRTPREILAILRRTYCGSLGVQYMHIADPAEKAWIQERSRAATRRSASRPRARSRSCAS